MKKTISTTLIAGVFALVLVGLMGISSKSYASTIDYPNIEVPTLGGAQLWQDTYVHAQWRIQKNVVTGHSRLLDPNNIRKAWGHEFSCMKTFKALKNTEAISPSSQHMVILLHGIARSTRTFSDMKKELTAQGYDAVVVSYPSTRATIEDHATSLNRLLDRLEGTKTVSFITHSMGGLVLRQALATESAWNETVKTGRIVMIAPPNQGSAIAQVLKNNPLYKAIYGDAGQQLTPGNANRFSQMENQEFAVIAGGRGDGQGFNPFLGGDDDGTVKVAETRLAGAKDQIRVPALHAVISDHPQTIQATLNFLKQGHLTPIKPKTSMYDLSN